MSLIARSEALKFAAMILEFDMAVLQMKGKSYEEANVK